MKVNATKYWCLKIQTLNGQEMERENMQVLGNDGEDCGMDVEESECPARGRSGGNAEGSDKKQESYQQCKKSV